MVDVEREARQGHLVVRDDAEPLGRLEALLPAHLPTRA
jgi:hypothetical protein